MSQVRSSDFTAPERQVRTVQQIAVLDGVSWLAFVREERGRRGRVLGAGSVDWNGGAYMTPKLIRAQRPILVESLIWRLRRKKIGKAAQMRSEIMDRTVVRILVSFQSLSVDHGVSKGGAVRNADFLAPAQCFPPVAMSSISHPCFQYPNMPSLADKSQGTGRR